MRNTDRNPAWVARFRDNANSMLFAENHPQRERFLEVIEQLTSCKSVEMARAWRLLGKSFDKFDKDEVPMGPEWHMYSLADTCMTFFDGFTHFMSISAAERREKAKEIASAAKKLKKSLQSLISPEFGLPEEFELKKGTWDIVVGGLERRRIRQSMGPEWDAGYGVATFDASSAVMRHLPLLLQALVDGAEVFASNPPWVAKPNAKDAHRTYFIRMMTYHFSNFFKKPLRTAVLAITGVFFDTTGMTTSRITEIAPLSKHRSGNRE